MSLATLTVMKSVTAPTKVNPARLDGAQRDIESECEMWDWARTAGVSAADLRKALRDLLEPSGCTGELPS